MLLLIDNYDSFTYNLVHYIGELGVKSSVYRNDALTVEEALALKPTAIVLSPGPATPNEAGICLDLVKAAAPDVPILGVCLGHQTIGQAFGGKVIRAGEIMHGKISTIHPRGGTVPSVFDGLPESFDATRYHSLIIERESLPDCLDVTAETDSGMIMGVAHKQYPTHGVQFHPESIASEHGHAMLKTFLKLAEAI